MFCTSTSLLSQEKIKWLSWQEAMELSKKEKRKIFVDVYTHWCGWCKKLDKTTFSESHIAQYINKNYYPIKFDAEMQTSVQIGNTVYEYVKNGSRGHHKLAEFLLQGRMSYPSMVFLDEHFGIIQAIPGYQDTQTFEMIITYFGSNSHKTTPWNKFMLQFQKDTYFSYLGKP